MKSYKMSLNGTELIYDINEHCVLLGNRRLQLNKDEIFPRPKIYYQTLYLIFDYPYKYYTFKLFEV